MRSAASPLAQLICVVEWGGSCCLPWPLNCVEAPLELYLQKNAFLSPPQCHNHYRRGVRERGRRIAGGKRRRGEGEGGPPWGEREGEGQEGEEGQEARERGTELAGKASNLDDLIRMI